MTTHYQLSWESPLTFANSNDYALLKIWKQPTLIMDWQAITVTQKENTTLSDVMGLHGIMVWSEAVCDALHPVVSDTIQLLPVHLNDETYHAVHITHVLDCLDKEQSQFRRFKNRNIGVERYVLRADCVADTPLFVLPDDGYSAVFVSDIVKAVIDDNHFTGLTFEAVG